MKTSEKGLKFLHNEEGLKLKAYKCPAGVWTIGLGNTFYEDGKPVKQGDVITKERANSLASIVVAKFEGNINRVVKSKINQNQFDALVSLSYNIGTAAFNKSTVLKKVNVNPNDPTIASSFEAWKNAGGKPILLARRKREHQLYFS